MKIGFIGQGYIGKNYADDFEKRGYEVIRYALEPEYEGNKEKIKDCDIVFIAVPTPTTPEGFSDKIVRSVIPLVGPGKIAVIKSTILPGTTKSIQAENPSIIVLNSPEFLSETTAAKDAANPFSNIVGTPEDSPKYKEATEKVLSVLPKAPYSLVCNSKEAEIIKYAHNGSAFVQIVFFNLMYDLASSMEADWESIEEAILADPYISNRYARPVHKTGRGAGGNCFIKDFAALVNKYKEVLPGDVNGHTLFKALVDKNCDLLMSTEKDIELLKGVYGREQ
ncbi:MAG: hypothetical protein COV70_00265 [Parcubacteria group bacterium CG11_big_fil_rev_8_21_14_0_20_39_22]|nr:MAG: hypothetical protein COV70_00265 [Parcubacteria group bacterium CG11_big_fil_rev_8_21_14_0_20_39_22]